MLKSDQKIWYEFDSKKSTFSDDISKIDQKNFWSNWYQIFLICICLEFLEFLKSIWYQFLQTNAYQKKVKMYIDNYINKTENPSSPYPRALY
jgi:hypothetical protein